MLIREEKTLVTAAWDGTKPHNLQMKVSFLQSAPPSHNWPLPDQRILLSIVSNVICSHSLSHYPHNGLMASRELLMATGEVPLQSQSSHEGCAGPLAVQGSACMKEESTSPRTDQVLAIAWSTHHLHSLAGHSEVFLNSSHRGGPGPEAHKDVSPEVIPLLTSTLEDLSAALT